jgi:uncharacterized protein YjbJ (UPF0337 family)
LIFDRWNEKIKLSVDGSTIHKLALLTSWPWNQMSRLMFRCHRSNQVSQRRLQMGSTADKVSGKANELAGQARQGVGKAVDDKEMQAKGLAQEAKGDAQQAKGEAKEAVKKVVDKA